MKIMAVVRKEHEAWIGDLEEISTKSASLMLMYAGKLVHVQLTVPEDTTGLKRDEALLREVMGALCR